MKLSQCNVFYKNTRTLHQAPRGIVAAAIASIFAEKLVAAGYAEAALLVPLTFSVIIGTVVLQSSTARFVARWLKVAEPSPSGFLIIGANPFAIAVAQELVNHDFRCLLADTNREQIRQARMAGLETYFGNPVSEHAEIHLDLAGIGGLLAISRQRDINAVAAIHFANEFGANRIFSLAATGQNRQPEQHKMSGSYQGTQLFGENISYADVVSMVARGREVKSTRLTEEFDWQAYTSKYGEARLPLFLIDAKGLVKPFTAEDTLQPEAGSVVIALAEEEQKQPH